LSAVAIVPEIPGRRVRKTDGKTTQIIILGRACKRRLARFYVAAKVFVSVLDAAEIGGYNTFVVCSECCGR
jgi:hypothetical protein